MTEKTEQMTVGLVDTVPALEEKLAALRTAQAKFATYTQEQVDCIFRAAALAANQARIPLAKMAVAETGMGVVEDKVIKNHSSLPNNFNIPFYTPLPNILGIQFHHFLKVRDIAPATHLPQSSQSLA